MGNSLVVIQSDPTRKICWYREDVSQDVDFEFVEVLIKGGIQERLELVQPLLDLLLRLREVRLAIFARVGFKSESLRRRRDQPSLKTANALINEVVD